jgi:hypothetical protein
MRSVGYGDPILIGGGTERLDRRLEDLAGARTGIGIERHPTIAVGVHQESRAVKSVTGMIEERALAAGFDFEQSDAVGPAAGDIEQVRAGLVPIAGGTAIDADSAPGTAWREVLEVDSLLGPLEDRVCDAQPVRGDPRESAGA